MWWWLPNRPSGNISLQLRTPETTQYLNLPLDLNVDEFDVDWPWRFAQIFDFLREDPMEIRPQGLRPGDIIVAGHFLEHPNAGLVIDLQDPETRNQFNHRAYVAMKGENWTIKIAQL